MAENSLISWCDHTFNPWIGCTKISPACDGCYAAHLMGGGGVSTLRSGSGERLPRRAHWTNPR
jgi:protein gp37